ncbi:MAG TPA: helix-turn-helix transcriptional regulator [Streptosporangiaceae bacterium]|jgi:transcriptional regulator with XRE-family HTH domain
MAEHANVYPLRREPQREPQPEPRPRERQAQEPLWREVLGRRLRLLRQEQQETLSETAARAGISPQYLSEVERGRKEPSSEMIAALAGALDTTLIDLTEQVAGDLRRQLSLAPLASRPQAARTRPQAGRTRPGDILALAA